MSDQKTVPVEQYNALVAYANRLERIKDNCRREYRAIEDALDEYIRVRDAQHADGGPSAQVDEAFKRLTRLAFQDAPEPPITHVACVYRGQVWSLPRPFRHYHVLRCIIAHIPDALKSDDIEDSGFLDGSGRYLNRENALLVALENGQVKGGKIIGGELTSEDLW